jgi:hypothetical protein
MFLCIQFYWHRGKHLFCGKVTWGRPVCGGNLAAGMGAVAIGSGWATINVDRSILRIAAMRHALSPIAYQRGLKKSPFRRCKAGRDATGHNLLRIARKPG